MAVMFDRLAVPLALLMCACSRRDPPPTQTVTTQPAPAASSAASIAPTQPVSTILSRAFFAADATLAMCVDADASGAIDGGTWTAQQRADAIKRAQAADAGALAASLVKSGPLKGGSSVVIQDECATAFRDRLELASCTTGPLTMRYYSFALLETDVEMRDCLQAHGNWAALARDSDEYHRAHARYEIEKAQRQAQRLQQQLGQ